MFFNYIDAKIFLASFAIGMFYVYIKGDDMKKIYIYPSPENFNDFIVEDNKLKHNKFIPGEHTRWLFINVLPFIFASTFMYGIFYKFIDLSYLSRLEIFASLVIFGMITLGINLLLVKEYRKNILTKIKGF